MFSQKTNTLFKLQSRGSLIALFCAFFAVTFLFYYPASNNLLVDDGMVGLLRFEQMGYKGFWRSFGFPSLYYFHDIFNIGVYLLVGKNSFGWFLVMAGLHSLNATLGFMVFRKFYAIMGVQKETIIALLGSILFLLSPYQIENVVWAATLHYGIALSIFLLGAYIILNGLTTGQFTTQSKVLLCGLFVVSLLTLEISLVFPFAWLVLAMAVIWNKKTTIKPSEFLWKVIVPMVLIIGAYFIATHLVKGRWLPHYGPDHLRNISIQVYAVNIAKYLLKIFGFAHFFGNHLRGVVYQFCEDKWVLVLALEFLLAGSIFFLLRAINKKMAANVFIAVILLSLVLFVPSLNMYFMYLFKTENDRLSYYFTLGAYQALALVLVSALSYTGVIITLLYSIPCMYFLHREVNKWRDAGIVHSNCITTFNWPNARHIYVLNCPTNYQGAYEFRNDERLIVALNFYKGYDLSQKIVHVLSSCYGSLNDSTVVSVVNDSTLNVRVVNNGGWLMNGPVGADDYSTDEYTVKIEKGYPIYNVTFHHKQPGDVYIYSTASGFKKLPDF